ARLFGETTRRLEALAPFDRRRSGNHQLPSRRPSRHATFNQRNHTLTQIKGIASRHPAPPDSEGNADSPISTPKGIPQSSPFRPSGECSKIMTAQQAAALIPKGSNVGMSGFTGAGYPK